MTKVRILPMHLHLPLVRDQELRGIPVEGPGGLVLGDATDVENLDTLNVTVLVPLESPLEEGGRSPH